MTTTTNALLTNNASSTLASSITNVATSLTVGAGAGALFPSPAAGEYFFCTLSNALGTTVEIVKVTARATDVFTVVRGQDGTSGQAFNAGDLVELRPVAALFREKVGGPSSAIDGQLAVFDGVTGKLIRAAVVGTATIPFTDGDTARRVTITDAAVSSTSKILFQLRRPDTTSDLTDLGFVYFASIVLQTAGRFDILVVARDWGGDDTSDDPPNETLTLNYTVL